MASDNEFGNHYRDGTVLVLLNDGSVKEIWPGPDDGGELQIGPESSHRLLRKLGK